MTQSLQNGHPKSGGTKQLQISEKLRFGKNEHKTNTKY